MSLLDEPCVLCGTTTRFHIDYCDPCWQEKEKIAHQCRKAKRAGLPGDLTIVQWREIVKTFNGMCAYCKERPYKVIEHFIPIELGGGTTISNCVPACVRCNSWKRDLHPEQVTKIPADILERVRFFLESQKLILKEV